jgi:hypothetical protein
VGNRFGGDQRAGSSLRYVIIRAAPSALDSLVKDTATRRSPRLLAVYRGLALVVLNTALLLVVLNLLAGWWLARRPGPELEGGLAYGMETLTQVYPHRSPPEIERLLRETWSRRYVYEPFTQFKEGAIAGEFVNVAAAGFRRTGRELPWPPVADRPTVFVFGGSTAFGYGLADDETIPARLGAALTASCGEEVAVYNFARSNYYSSQENILFQRLLVQGVRPEMVVFIDGLNEFGHRADEPKFTERLAYLMTETPAQLGRRWLVDLPLARLTKRLLARSDLRQRASVEAGYAEQVVARWLANRAQIRAVAQASGIETLFVWQPIPSYGYDLSHHLFAPEADAERQASAVGFALLAERRQADELAADLLWLADMQRAKAEPLYVDQVHYTASFSSEIAAAIAAAAGPRLCRPAANSS